MSDVLNDDDASGFAAEFVLGTLDGPERARAQRMLGSDRSFTAMVKIWERRLGELHLMVEPVEPDPALWQRVRARALPASGSDAAVTPATPSVGAAPTVIAASEPPPPPPIPPAALIQPAPAPEPAPEPASDAPALIAPAPEPVELVPMQTAAASEAVSSTEVEALRAAIAPAPAAAISVEPRFERVSEAPVEPKALVRPPEPTVVIPVADRRPESSDRTTRQLRHWRAFGLLMMLLAIGLGGLIATWRYAPERLPPQFRPLQVLHIEPVGPAGRVRPPAPPESQFNE